MLGGRHRKEDASAGLKEEICSTQAGGVRRRLVHELKGIARRFLRRTEMVYKDGGAEAGGVLVQRN